MPIDEKKYSLNPKVKAAQQAAFDAVTDANKGLDIIRSEAQEADNDIKRNYMVDFANKSAKGILDNPETQELIRTAGSDRERKSRINKALNDAFLVSKQYKSMKNDLDWLHKPYEEKKKAYDEQMRSDLKDRFSTLGVDIDNSLQDTYKQESQKKRDEEGKLNWFIRAGGNIASAKRTPMPFEGLPETGNYAAAKEYINDTHKLIREYEKRGESKILGAARGARDAVFDPDTWSLGILEMDRSNRLQNAVNKFEKNEQLSDSEQKMLDALSLNLAASAYYKGGNKGYNWGQIAGESAPFMLEFMLNPIAGAGKGMAKKIATYGIKRFGKSVAGKVASKAAGAITKDLIGAVGMTATTGSIRTGLDAVTRMQGEDTYGVEDGNPVYAGREGGEDALAATAKAVGSNVIEYYSEMLGNRFGEIGGLVGKSRLGKGVKASKIGQVFEKMDASPIYRELKSLERRGQWSGTIGEWAEEQAGTLLNAAFVGDSKFSDIADKEQQIDTFMGLFLTGGVMSAVKTSGYVADRVRSYRKLSALESKMPAYFANWDEIKGSVKNMDVEQRSDAVKKLMGRNDISIQAKQDLASYVGETTFNESMRSSENELKKKNKNIAKEQGATLFYKSIQDKRSLSIRQINNEMSRYEQELGGLLDLPAEEVDSMVENGELTPEQVEIINKFEIAKSRYDGVMNALKAEVDEFIKPKIQQIDSVTREDGTIVEINVGTEIEPDMLYVYSGNVSLNEDGILDRINTDKIVYAVDGNGNKKQVASSKIQHASISNSDEIKQGVTDMAYAKFVDPLAEKMDGVHAFQLNEQVEFTTDKGETIAGTIAAKQNETVTVVSNDGKKTMTYVQDDLNNRLVGETLNGFKARDIIPVVVDGETYEASVNNIKDGVAELYIPNAPMAEQQFIDVDASGLQAILAPVENIKTSENESENEISPSEIEDDLTEESENIDQKDNLAKKEAVEYPRNKSGEIEYDKITDDEMYISALQEEFGDEAKDVVSEYLKGAEKKLKNVSGIQDPINRKRAERKAKADVDRFKAMSGRLNPTTTYEDRMSAIEQGKIKDREANMGDYVSLRDYLLRNIATGRFKFMWNSDGVRRGLKDEILASRNTESERKKRISFLNNRGYTPESLAHEIWENAGQGSEITEGWFNDVQDIRNEINEILLSNDTPTSMIDAATELRKQPETSEEYYENFADPAEIAEWEADEASQNNLIRILPTAELYPNVSEYEIEEYYDAQISEEEFTDILNNINFEEINEYDTDQRSRTEDHQPDAVQVAGTEEAAHDKRGIRSLFRNEKIEGDGNIADAGTFEEPTERSPQDSLEQLDKTGTGQDNGRNVDATQGISDVRIVDYSDKAIAVYGDSREYKDKFKELGGRYNNRLREGSGWIFPKSKKNAILSVLNIGNQENNDNFVENENDEISESVSERNNRSLSVEAEGMGEESDSFQRSIETSIRNAQADKGSISNREINSIAEKQSKDSGKWIPLSEQSELGEPFPSGVENEVYYNEHENAVYKVNNLSTSRNIPSLLDRIKLHNELFPNTKYELVGFSGFGGGIAYPIIKQAFIPNATYATPSDIESYMISLGFKLTGKDSEYSNDEYIVDDLRPRNVLKDVDGDIYVIDAGIKRAKENEDAPKSIVDFARNVVKKAEIEKAAQAVDQNPSEAQKEAGNYQKGSVRSGTDAEVKNSDENNYGSQNSIITREKYEELKQKMRDKLNNMNVGFDPEMLSLGAQMAMYHIEAGARKFADFAKRMIADFGDDIKPYLKAFYEGARAMPGMEELSKTMDPYNDVVAFDVNKNFNVQSEYKERKEQISREIDDLIKIRDQKYPNPDIESPMSPEEKELNSRISKLQSDRNQLVLNNRKQNGQKERSTETIEAETETVETASGTIRSESENVGSDKQRAGQVKEKADDQIRKIEDFGEKIGGARKDIAQEYKKKLSDVNKDDLKSKPLSKIFPRPNFKELVEAGALSLDNALFMNMLYDSIPTKPRVSYKLSRWIDTVEQVITTYKDAFIHNDKVNYLDQLKDKTIRRHSQGTYYKNNESYPLSDEQKLYIDKTWLKIQALKALGFPNEVSSLKGAEIEYSVARADNVFTVTIGNKRARFTTFEDVVDYLKGELSNPQKKETVFNIYSNRLRTQYFVAKPIQGKEPVRLSETFQSSKEAYAYLRDHRDEIQAKWDAINVKPEERRTENRDRRGRDWRNGKDITPDQFQETFGFRGTEFGNWVNQGERQSALNDAHDALMDLSSLLNISPKAISLNGELGMAFGARGTGNAGGSSAAAHYEPGKVVINLTKKSGAGSLGHEWWHALDNYFSRKGGQDTEYATENTRNLNESVRKEMKDAFDAVMKSINDSELPKRSNGLDSTRSKPYWSTNLEMSARAFENFINSKLVERDDSNDYLVNFKALSEWVLSGNFEEDTFPYPTNEETPAINEKFQQFFDMIQEKVDEDTGNVVLFRPNKSKEAFAEREWNRAKRAVNEIAERLKVNVEILETTDGLAGKKATEKGWYDTRTGKISIVMPNHRNSMDVQATLLHEAVGHHGLRELFGGHFDTFLDNVYNNANESIVRAIKGIQEESGVSQRVATEEYLSYLAEDRSLLDGEGVRSWLGQVKKFFIDMLAKVGIDLDFYLSDNELKYILWRSFKNLEEPGRFRNPVNMAKDVVIQSELKVGNFAETGTPATVAAESNGTVYRDNDDLEIKSIKDESVKNGTFMKAPNGKPTNLTERQWLQVRTKAFKDWFGDWQNLAVWNYLTGDKYVSEITGNEFQKDNTPLTEKVAKYYLEKYNGAVEREGLGTVELSERGVKDSLSHGIGRTKSAAFASVPEIIQNGVIIDSETNWKGRGYDSVTIAAPVKIGDAGYTGIVVVTRKEGGNRFYLHEVVLQEKLRTGFKTGQAGSPDGALAKVMQKFKDASKNAENISKVIDENGEPMVVYHGTNAEFTEFMYDRAGSNTKNLGRFALGFYFTPRYETAEGYKKNRPGTVMPVFLNIKAPLYYNEKADGNYMEFLDDSDVGEYLDYEYTHYDLDDALRMAGYDGVVADKASGVREIVSLEPTQIKSATDNVGTFDGENADIRFRTADNLMDNADDLSKAIPDYNGFIGKVYQGSPKKGEIYDKARANGMDLRKATEDYMAGLSDPVELERIKRLMGADMPDNALKYMLWRNVNPNDGSAVWSAKESIKRKELDGNVLFRMSVRPTLSAIDEYNRRLNDKKRKDGTFGEKYKGFFYKLEESFIDDMRAVRILQEAITGKKQNIPDHSNVFRYASTVSSRSQAAIEKYNKLILKPLIIHSEKIFGKNWDLFNDYLIAKHGLERNEHMAREESKKAVEKELDELEAKRADNLIATHKYIEQLSSISEKREQIYKELITKKDYSGLTGLAKERKKGESFKEAGKNLVNEVESKASKENIDELWGFVNKATKTILQYQYEAGIMDKEQYEFIRDMYQYYVPMRGFDETTAEEFYEYMEAEMNDFNSVLKSAIGRTSKPDQPMPQIGSMAMSGILQAEKNKFKQKLFALVATNPSNLATINDVWLVKSGDEWVEKYPEIPDDATSEQVWESVTDFNNRMADLQEKGESIKGRNKLNTGMRIGKAQASEHAVNVWIAGKEKVIYVNGNPRAAQAINGLTKSSRINDNNVMKVSGKVTRTMAALNTGWNPSFMFTNYPRDVRWAVESMFVQEGARYAIQLWKNIPRTMETVALNVWGDGGGEYDEMWHEFSTNGGETGYAHLQSIEHIRKYQNDLLKKAAGQRDFWIAARTYGQYIENANRMFEASTRFAVYVTSRERGKSVGASISDAKEVTVNFNRKGSGEMAAAGVAHNMFMFINPAIQSLKRIGYLAKTNPARFAALQAYRLTMGFMQGAMGAWIAKSILSLFGDDDDKEKYKEGYYALSPWVRRTNTVIPVPGTDKFLTIPLPHEDRAMHGIGVILYDYMSGHLRTENLGKEIAKQMTQALPLDPLGGKTTFVPSAFVPITEVLGNENFMERPIYKNNTWNEMDPGWTKAYRGTNKYLVELARYVNEIQGGDEFTKKGYDINPAILDHLVNGYLGGSFSTYTMLFNAVAQSIAGDVGEKPTLNEWPVANKLVKTASDRTVYNTINNEYFYNKEWADKIAHRDKGYRKRGDTERLDKLHGSDDWMRYQTVAPYLKMIERMKDNAAEASLMDMKAELNETVWQMRKKPWMKDWLQP